MITDPEIVGVCNGLRDAIRVLTDNALNAEGAEQFEEAATKYLDVARAAGGIAGCFMLEAGRIYGEIAGARYDTEREEFV